jgi:DNA-binding NarL/FixJ family response regulator
MENQGKILAVYISEVLTKRQIMPNALAPFNILITATEESYEKMKSRFEANDLDFILLEYDFMPKDIHALIKEIKTDHPEIRLLIIGAFNIFEVAETFLKSGANGYYDQHCLDSIEGMAKAIRNIENGIPVIMPSTHQRKSYS